MGTAYRATRACCGISAGAWHTAADRTTPTLHLQESSSIVAIAAGTTRSSFDYQRLEMAKPCHACVFRQIAALGF